LLAHAGGYLDALRLADAAGSGGRCGAGCRDVRGHVSAPTSLKEGRKSPGEKKAGLARGCGWVACYRSSNRGLISARLCNHAGRQAQEPTDHAKSQTHASRAQTSSNQNHKKKETQHVHHSPPKVHSSPSSPSPAPQHPTQQKTQTNEMQIMYHRRRHQGPSAKTAPTSSNSAAKPPPPRSSTPRPHYSSSSSSTHPNQNDQDLHRIPHQPHCHLVYPNPNTPIQRPPTIPHSHKPKTLPDRIRRPHNATDRGPPHHPRLHGRRLSRPFAGAHRLPRTFKNHSPSDSSARADIYVYICCMGSVHPAYRRGYNGVRGTGRVHGGGYAE